MSTPSGRYLMHENKETSEEKYVNYIAYTLFVNDMSKN